MMQPFRTMAAVLVLAAAGCKPPPVAPTELSDLTRFLYREWPDTDPEPMESAVANLRNFLQPINDAGHLTGDISNREWLPTAPQKTDLTSITWPTDRDPQKCLGVSVAFKSVWPIEDHARLQIQANQMPKELTATKYDRKFTNQATPACFVDRSCTEMDTTVTSTDRTCSWTFTIRC